MLKGELEAGTLDESPVAVRPNGMACSASSSFDGRECFVLEHPTQGR